MKALSIRQPWAWLIIRPDLKGGEARLMADLMSELKDVENRSWHTKFRGRFLVHASKGMTLLEYNYVRGFLEDRKLDIVLPDFKELQRGGIIGSVELVDSVDHSKSPWYMGQKGFVLRDPQPMEFIPFKGRLQFFEVPHEPSV